MLTGRLNLRRGDAREVQVYASDTQINLGDLVCTVAGEPVPASEIPWNTDLTTTQAAMVALFLGVALDKQLVLNNKSEPELLLVGTQGDYHFACDALPAGIDIGTMVGAAENEAGDGLEADKVAEVADADHAIGVVVEDAPEGATQLLVRVRSALADRVLS